MGEFASDLVFIGRFLKKEKVVLANNDRLRKVTRALPILTSGRAILHWYLMGTEQTESDSLDFVLLAADELCPDSIVGDLCADPSIPSFLLDGTRINLHTQCGEPSPVSDWEAALSDADAFAITVRYVDVITMDRLRDIYRVIALNASKPFGIMVYRGEGEDDYKMSCPFCGQKLWVRDSDINKRGRCPNCKKAFPLPSQSDHVRDQLHIEEGTPLASIKGGDDSSLKAAFRTILNGSVAK